MENRLKERLTGAAILVALIVMLVPEMFRGQGGEPTATSSSSGEGPPVRTYTIDLSNSPSRNMPLQSTPTTAMPTTVMPTTASPATSAPAPNAPKAEARPEPAKSEAARVEPAKVSAPPQSATRVARAATSASTPRPTAAGGWSVQVGIFARRDNAERMMHEVQGKGFNVAVSGADSKGLFHVHAVGLPDRAAALTLSQRMKADGLAATVVAPQ
jgi:DedD protein